MSERAAAAPPGVLVSYGELPARVPWPKRARAGTRGWFRNEGLGELRYRLSAAEVWAGVQAVLEGSEWLSPRRPGAVLIVAIGPAGEEGTAVQLIRRWPAPGPAEQVERAFDLEWTLLRHLDPARAMALEAAARRRARSSSAARAGGGR